MSNGREIGTVVGSLVAAYFTAGTSYAALAVAAGGAVGGAVGGAIDGPTRIQGQRLDDLKVQFSSYGAGIPILYGTERIAPNVIWSTDKIELATTTSAGKGASTETTNYKYYVHMRVLLCETPRDGSTVYVSKIYKDGALIWDISAGTSLGTALASAENLYSTLTVFQGGPDQLPDGREESWTGGPGTAPAYRRVVTALLTAVECPGGRIPQYSFVCSTGAAPATEIFSGEAFDIPYQMTQASRINSAAPTIIFGCYMFGGATPNSAASFGLTNSYSQRIERIQVDSRWYVSPTEGDADIDAMCIRQSGTGGDTGVNDFVSPDGSRLASFNVGLDCLCDGTAYANWSKCGDLVSFVDRSSGLIRVMRWSTGEIIGEATVANQRKSILTESLLWVFDAASVWVYAVGSDSVDYLTKTTAPVLYSGAVARMTGGPNDTLKFFLCSTHDAVLWTGVYTLADGLSFSITSSVNREDGTIPYPPLYPVSVDGKNVYYLRTEVSGGGTGNTNAKLIYLLFDRVQIESVPVSSIIADQCERAGNISYDVSDIPDTDTVYGYKLANPASARANCDPLLTCFSIYVVDEDGATKFRKLSSITSTATVAFDELGFAQAGSDSMDAMPLSRTQEIDLPRSVTVSYIEPAFDFQTASEPEIRQVTDATEDLTIQLPLAINSDQAKRAAQTILYASWRSQNTRSLTVSRKYSANSPGDGVTIEYPRGTNKLWRIMSTNDTGASIEWTVEPGDAQLFTQTAVGAIGYEGQVVAPLPPPTQIKILDTSILRDTDNNAGPYVALSGFSDGWPGAELRVGPDESSVVPRGTVENESEQGYAETLLGSWSLNVVDETNLVTVNVGRFELSSITRDVLVSSSQVNAAAIGINGRWEIIKFQRVDSLGGGRYVLSGLLRGLRGTEWAASLHQPNDDFILLKIAGLLRPATAVGDIGQTLVYEAITKGRPSSTATITNYANTGEGLKPFSPVNLRKRFSGTDIVLTWSRRTRLSENAFAGILPLGESSEAYAVTIYSDSTFTSVKRVIPAYSETATYVTADQVSDFGSAQTTLYVRVQQRSDSIGLGHELQATV